MKWNSFFLLILLTPLLASARLVEYDLTIEDARWAPPGHGARPAITVNGTIPGPTLRFRVGDTARIRVHNRMKKADTSTHWHGLLLPNAQDGVPYVTTPPILPGTTHTFEFPIKHEGTYWYHSHTGHQEQSGVFGSIVIDPRTPGPKEVDREAVIVLSDWSRENPDEIFRSLLRGTEWYEIRKKTAQSLVGAIRAGAFREFWERERSRMLPMDVSDIAYDAFLINGTENFALPGKPGERVKLRFINASAATYFYVESSTGPLKIVAADGPPVEPLRVKRLFIGMAETYDVVITIPPSGKWEVRATAQDGSGHASLWLGNGEPRFAPDVPKPDNYRMDAHLMAALQQQEAPASEAEALANEPPRPLSPYARLRARESTELPRHLPRRTITLRATGDMERYTWGFNGKTFAEDGVIPIKRGEVIRLELINDTMMHHPLHLHGHFFRLLMGQKGRAPLKHTVDLPPMGRRTIEFEANDEGDWLFHCHLLYHMHAGMTRIFSYQDASWTPPPSDDAPSASAHGGHSAAPAPAPAHGAHGGEGSSLTHTPHGGGHEHDPSAFLINADFFQSYSEGVLALRNSRNDWYARWEFAYQNQDHAEYELGWRRYLDANRGFRLGVRYAEATRERVQGVVGFDYRLPFLVWSRVEAASNLSVRVGLEKELPITSRLYGFGAISYDTRESWEWRAGGRFVLGKYVNLVAQYHSHFGAGVGLGITF